MTNVINNSTIDQKALRRFRICWYTSVAIMVVASALQHFLYDWTQCPFIGLWAPVSESPAEHNKLLFYPLLTWWIVMFFSFRKQLKLNPVSWFTSAGVAAIAAISLMTAFYCVFFIGFEWPQFLPLHILFEIIAFILSQLVAYHLYKWLKPNIVLLAIIAILTLTVIVLMAVFTFNPPDSLFFQNVE